jgi:hypothetical protein
MAPEVVVFNRHRLPTVEDLVDELEEARQLALHPEIANPGAAVAATLAKGKLLGLLVTRLQVERTQPFAHLTVEQLMIKVHNELGPDAAKKIRAYQRQLELERKEPKDEPNGR